MACCLSCCKYTAMFGIIFYISMGFIVAFQVEFLKFEPENQGDSIGACFLTAFLELAIFIGLTCYERKEQESSVTRPEYLKFEEEKALNRQRESSMRGIDLVDLRGLSREEKREEEREEREEKVEKVEPERIDLL